MALAIKITSVQRDAFYDVIVDRIDGIGDIPMAIEYRKFAEADKLARDYRDYLDFVSTDLGWGDRSFVDEIELKTPPDVLCRVFTLIEGLADGMAGSDRAQAEEVLELEKRNRILAETCKWGLARLGGEMA